MSKFRCTVCNWVYDEDKEDERFKDLPDSFTCPVCGAPKSAFKPYLLTKDTYDSRSVDGVKVELVPLYVFCLLV